jgi:hypothetical protein
LPEEWRAKNVKKAVKKSLTDTDFDERLLNDSMIDV